MIIAFHVDDLLIASSDLFEIQLVYSQLYKTFKIKYIREDGEFWGLRITCNIYNRFLYISQTSYIKKGPDLFRITGVNPYITPNEIPTTNSVPASADDPHIQAPYGEAIGSFI